MYPDCVTPVEKGDGSKSDLSILGNFDGLTPCESSGLDVRALDGGALVFDFKRPSACLLLFDPRDLAGSVFLGGS